MGSRSKVFTLEFIMNDNHRVINKISESEFNTGPQIKKKWEQ